MPRSQPTPRTAKPNRRDGASYRAYRDAIRDMSESEDLLPLARDLLSTLAASTH